MHYHVEPNSRPILKRSDMAATTEQRATMAAHGRKTAFRAVDGASI